MSKKQQTPEPSEEQPKNTNVHRALVVVIAAIVVGTGLFVWQATRNTDKILNNTKDAQAEDPKDEKTDEYAGWKNYTWESEGLSFKHPGDWLTSETASMGRLYVKNSDVNLLKESAPADFQQIWLSVDTDEAAQAREDAIKKGESMYRTVAGEVKASTIKSGDLTINVYEYQTVGGPTLEAYWTGKDGKRYYATNSTEIGEDNQTEMVATLKKVLASVAFVN
jgi:hypothetical protein